MDPRLLQFGPVDVRIVGVAFVGVLALAFLYVLVRYDDLERDDPVYEDDEDDGGGLPSFGPAYGAGGHDVETVLGIDGDDSDDDPGSGDRNGDDGDREEGWGAGTPEFGDLADSDPGDGEDSELVLSHEVIDDPRDDVLVEVTDGDRVGRFYVEDPDAEPSIRPASGATERLDEDFRRTAEDYLRAVVLAGDLHATETGWE